ncbi:outer membrane beta-barrel family protein [Larkinella humicola]|uniref:TonB-dependent receptor n=1 Tax=Larkinella humicola TaxID=2607654 RepID=A0A5N1JNV4_9BACT|nr:outer membrane beta-barrel family protein [Larkinella humicola]KAA9357306.1 TonB-dependent receptor [Larkinella humicola]
MLKRVLIVALLFASGSLTAQPPQFGGVTGLVHDSGGSPLELVTLLLLKATDSTLVKGTVSNQQGVYEFETIPAGTYLVATSLVGFQKTYSRVFTVGENQWNSQLPSLVVREETRQLSQVTVKAQKPFIEQQLDKTVLNVENSLVATGGTALEVLEKAPGVVVDGQSDRISLKGRDQTLVMIDGKPTYLSAAQVMDLLRNTPSNTIEAIELIPNPPARYDAAGNAGIINIRLKRNRSAQRLNGNLTAGLGQGRFLKYNTGLTLNARTGPWSWFGTYAFDQRDYWSVANIDRRLAPDGEPLLIRQETYRPIQNTSHSFRFGADFAPNRHSTIGLLLNGMNVGNRSQGGTTSVLYKAGVLTSTEETGNDNQRTIDRLAANLNYRHRFDTTSRGGKGRELRLDVDYSDASFRPLEQFENRYLNPQGVETGPRDFQRLHTVSKALIQAAKADYVHPIDRRTTVEGGWKSSFVTLKNDLQFETKRAEAGQTIPWQLDTSRTNQFEYRETIHAGYLTGRRNWANWTLQVGLRLEQTRTEAYSVTAHPTVKRSYLNLFPNVSLTRQVGKNHQFQYTFSRRIDRPDYQFLNPFIRIYSPYMYQQGNPYLKPQYTDAFQLGYSYKDETTVSVSYAKTRDVIADINEQNDITGVTRVTLVNLAKQRVLGLNLSSPVRFARWWSARNTANLSYSSYQSGVGGTPLNTTWTSANLTSHHTFVFPQGLSAELAASYNSPYVYSQNKMRAYGQVSVGFQKSLWQKKAVLRFNWGDLFQTQRYRGTLQFQQMDFRFASYAETRVARLTFTYHFGNRELKGAGNRRTVSEEEQRRMN